MSHAFLAVDWGTSSRRVHRIHNGEVLATERDDRGATAVAAGDFASEAAAIRAGFRARGLLGLLDPADAASFASGVLIGADVAARISPDESVHILADAELGALYPSAVEALGGTTQRVDSHAALVAGAGAGDVGLEAGRIAVADPNDGPTAGSEAEEIVGGRNGTAARVENFGPEHHDIAVGARDAATSSALSSPLELAPKRL